MWSLIRPGWFEKSFWKNRRVNMLIQDIRVQYFYSFKASYDASYEASQMFCFTTQCNQNKTFEKPCTRCCTSLWKTRYTGLNSTVFSMYFNCNFNAHICSAPHTRLLKYFVLITLCCKANNLRSLVRGIIRGIIRGFEWIEILGLPFRL